MHHHIFAQGSGLLMDLGPTCFGRQIEAHKRAVHVHQPLGTLAIQFQATSHPRQFIGVDIIKALEDERQDVILITGNGNLAADGTGGFPEPGFEGG